MKEQKITVVYGYIRILEFSYSGNDSTFYCHEMQEVGKDGNIKRCWCALSRLRVSL